MTLKHFELISDIEKHGEDISEWETEFIDSISHRIKKGESLSKKQADILIEIHEKRVG